MIKVDKEKEPDSFESNCRGPGKIWLDENPNEDPHKNPLWTNFRNDLRIAFKTRCGFLAMRIQTGTVDHWTSIHSDRSKAYEWDNFRFVDGVVNSTKKPKWEGKLLDPFEVENEWFEIDLPSLQLRIANIPDDEMRERAEFTLDKFRLKDGEDVIRMREEWLELYEENGLDLDGLYKVAPLLARAISKRDGLPTPE